MKILFILENHYPNIGGVETLFKDLTEELVKHHFEVTVLTTQFSKSLARQEVLNGVNIIRVPLRNRYLFTFLGMFPAIKEARKYDLIHTTSYNAGIPAFFAGLLTRKKVLITFHEVWGKLWFSLPFMNKLALSLHYLFEQFLLLLPFYKFIAVSNYTRTCLIESGIKKDKVERIYNGIDYTKLNPIQTARSSDESFQFIYYGRLGISKGLDILLDAIRELRNSTDKFILKLIIPTEPSDFHQRIRTSIIDMKIDDCIEIKSDLSKEELNKEIQNSDAVVIPSYSEGFCFTAVEAMALGVPIISSGKGALKEVVTGQFLTMKTHDGKGLKTEMLKALNGEWDQSSPKEYLLKDSVSQYVAMYKAIEDNSSTTENSQR